MSDNNRFQPYRYNQGQSDPVQSDQQSLNLSASRYLQDDNRGLGGFLRRPFVMAGAGLFGILLLTVILVNAVTGSSTSSDGDVPIVQAQAEPAKTMSGDVDNFRFPNSDSTIYQSTSAGAIDQSSLAGKTTEPVVTQSKLEMLAKQAQEMAAKTGSQDPLKTPQIEVATAPVTVESATSAFETRKAAIPDYAPSAPQEVPTRMTSTQEQKTYAAGSSPETLAFVKSVLDQKDQKQGAKTAEAPKKPEPITISKPTVTVKAKPAPTQGYNDAYSVNNIQPAAGTEGVDIKPGTYYVQLASVKDRSSAVSEWGKLQSRFSGLSEAKYRITRADLAKGTFYRIQAGPMSKESADQVCGSVKSASGACFVTK